jgi:hypothetical protein
VASAQDLIKGALRRINSYQSGEALAQPDAQDCLDTLNDLLDSWSIDKNLIYGSVENILPLIAGQAQYRIGNPLNTALGLPNFTGYLAAGSPVITGVIVPAQMVLLGTLSDVQSAVPSGATITAFSANSNAVPITFTAPPTGSAASITPVWAGVSGLGLITFSDGETIPATFTAGNASVTFAAALTGTPTVSATVNINTITMSAPSTVTQTAADVFSYTIPGDWAIPRPNRITHGFTRFSQLDFTCEVTMSQSRFTEILYKAQPGPWPTVAWYNPQMPYGLLNFYQTPGNSSLFHLFTDTILSSLTLNQTFELPAGYARAIKWCLAKEICAEYGYEITEAIRTHAAESLAMVKALNAQPAAKARYDSMLVGNRANASWIFTGGYN